MGGTDLLWACSEWIMAKAAAKHATFYRSSLRKNYAIQNINSAKTFLAYEKQWNVFIRSAFNRKYNQV